MLRITDSYSPITAYQAKAIKDAGYAGSARYLGARTLQLPNGMFPSEAKRLHDAGLKIVSIWETNPTQASYFTVEQARLDALHALEEAAWMGQPPGSAIYFTVDYDAQEADMDAIIAYFSMIRSMVSGRYLVGAYGGIRTLESLKGSRGAPNLYWQTLAWSGGQRFDGAALYQGLMDQSIDGLGIDVNDVLVENPGWWPIEAIAAKPVPVPEPVKREPTEWDHGYAEGIEAAIKQLEAMKR